MTQTTWTAWIKATRPQFFTVIILPILLGTVIAKYTQDIFSLPYLILSLLAGILFHASINVINDYFDHLNKTDVYNITPLTPFAGGSRTIQNGILSANQMYYYGLVLLGIAISIGLFLVAKSGLMLLWIGIIGALSGYFYSAPPFALHSRCLGELLIGLNFGVLAVLGAYYVQTQSLDMIPFIASLPLAALVTAILYINEFPDMEADKKAGKITIIVYLGNIKARPIYVFLIVASFISVILGVIYQYLPLLALTCLLTLPLGFKAIKTVYSHYEQSTALIPAIKNTIMMHTVTSLLLIMSFMIEVFVFTR
ncbi:MAG: 1,4-dihydroxy-2-naphthoate octaprenyltransferase [Thiomargarita sp.]|nr:1,4-dihydroxy-2-naphthoate octaprenyltransferase [Thiomargarita sp.]